MKFKNKVQKLIYGEAEDKAAADKAAADKTRIYDQKGLDDIVGKTKAEMQRKFDDQRKADLEKMASLETDVKGKADLEKQIADLNERYKSKEELAADSAKKERQERELKQKTIELERDTWRSKLEQKTLLSDLTTAASKKVIGNDKKETEVHNAQQLVKYLKPDARVVEKIVDGKPTGEFETRIKYTDSKGKELDLVPDEVIKLMSEDPQHHNFFKGGVVGGLGTSGGRQGAGGDGKLGMSQEKFNEGYLKGTLPKRN